MCFFKDEVECVWTPGKVLLALTKAFWCFSNMVCPFAQCSSLFHLFHFKLSAPEWSPSREVDAPLLLPSGLMLSRRKRLEAGEVPSSTNVSLASRGCQVNKDQYTHRGCLVWNSALHPSKAQMPVLKGPFDPFTVVRNSPRWMNVFKMFNKKRLTSRAIKWKSKIILSKTRCLIILLDEFWRTRQYRPHWEYLKRSKEVIAAKAKAWARETMSSVPGESQSEELKACLWTLPTCKLRPQVLRLAKASLAHRMTYPIFSLMLLLVKRFGSEHGKEAQQLHVTQEAKSGSEQTMRLCRRLDSFDWMYMSSGTLNSRTSHLPSRYLHASLTSVQWCSGLKNVRVTPSNL